MKAISLYAKFIVWILLSASSVNNNICQAFTLSKSSDVTKPSDLSSSFSLKSMSQPLTLPLSSSTRRSSSWRESLTTLNAQGNKDEEAVLTDLDARVLQEMLRDSDKLNLQDEKSMKDLLDRGIKAKEGLENEEEESQQEEDSEFKSEALQRLGSTKLWKALKRKLQDSVESAKIYVSNRIERDAKLVASLGIFAFERAMNDVARALPATSSSRWNPKKQFLLSNVTAAESMTEAQRLRQEMSTPLDEIRNVGRQLKDIFRGVSDVPAASANYNNVEADPNEIVTPRNTFSRNLNSAAASSKYSVNDKAKFDKAYKRKQETTLKREKENVIQSSSRLANEVVDSAYEIRREVQAETNQPGYKTKAIRAQTAATSRQLAAGAKRILGGAKSIAVKALEASRQQEEMSAPLLPETAAGVPEVDMSVGLNADTVPTMPDAQQAAPPSLERLELLDELETEMERVLDLLNQYISSPRETWLDPDLLLQKNIDNTEDQEFTTFPDTELESVVVAMVKAQALLEEPTSNEDERAMISTLELVLPTVNEICETSLKGGSSIIADYFKQTLVYGGVQNGEVPLILRLDDCLARLETLEEEQQLTQDIERAMNAATGPAVAEPAPWFFEDESEEEVQETKPWYMEDGVEDDPVVEVSDSTSFGGFRMPWQKREDNVDDIQDVEVSPEIPSAVGESSVFIDDVEILDAIPTTMGGPAEATIVDNEVSYTETVAVDQGVTNGDFEASSSEVVDSMRRVAAEVVSDDEFDVAMGQAKVATEIEEGQVEEEEDEEPNAATMFALRSLDVVLLAGEKTAAVFPTLINLGGTVTERVANAKSDGLGSSGWEIIQSAQRGDKKY